MSTTSDPFGARATLSYAGGEVTWSRDQEGFLLQLRLPAGASA